MALLEAKFDPWPQLSFEYANGGSLDLYPATSTLEEVQYMCQLLSALTAMHTRTPPVVHRDIKPDNILRFVSPDGSIHVKLADFGLGKNADQLKTFCGSLRYAAPEIYAKVITKDAERYTASVDIWSLAVVFAERAGGLPEYYNSYKTSTTAWNTAVSQYFWNQSDGGSDLIPFLLDNMLHIEPHMRKPASYCHDQAFRLFRRLSQRHAPAQPRDQDSMRALIAELGYRGSSKIESIINPTDNNNNNDEVTFRCSHASQPDTQRSRAANMTANQSVATIVEGKLWVDEQTWHSGPDGIIPTIEARASRDGAVLEGLDLSTRIRRFLGGDLVGDENRVTRPLDEHDLERTFRPAPKKARLGDPSSIGLVQVD